MADPKNKQQSVTVDPNTGVASWGSPNQQELPNNPNAGRGQGANVPPSSQHPSLEAAPPPSPIARVWNAVKEGIPAFNSEFEVAATTNTPEGGTMPSGRQAPTESLLTPAAAMTPEEQKAHPFVAGAADTIRDLATPGNIFLMALPGGEEGEAAEAARPLINKAAQYGLTAQALLGAYESVPAIKQAIDSGDASTAERLIAHTIFGLAVGAGLPEVSKESIREKVEGAGVPEAESTLSVPKPEKNAPAAEEEAPEPSIQFNSLGGKEVRSAKDMRGSASFGRTGGKFGNAVDTAFDVGRKYENEAEPEIELLSPEEEKTAESGQGGHAGGGVASVEELNRRGRFVKIGRNSLPTDQGKTPDFNLGPGEAGYQVKPDGTWELKAGQETPSTKLAVQKYAREVFPNAFREPIPKQYEQALARRGNLPNQRVNLSPAYDETGKYVGGLSQHNLSGTPEERKATMAQRMGTYNGSGLMAIPQDLIGYNGTTHSTITHELAHSVVADLLGLPINDEGIKSHMHPDNIGTGAAASMGLDYSKISGAKKNPYTGKYSLDQEALSSIWPKFATTAAAGGVAEEIGHNIPTAFNSGLVGDSQIFSRIGKTMGFTDEEVANMRSAAEKHARDILNHPETMDIIKTAAGEREPNLSKTLHMSPEKVRDVINRVKEARKNVNSEGTGTDNSQFVSKTETQGAGTGTQENVRGGNGETLSDTINKSRFENYGLTKNQADRMREAFNPESNQPGFILPDGNKLGSEDSTHLGHIGDIYNTDRVLDSKTRDYLQDFLDKTGAVRITYPDQEGSDIVGVHLGKTQPNQSQIQDTISAARKAGAKKLIWQIGNESGEGSFGEFQRAVHNHYAIEDTKLPEKTEKSTVAESETEVNPDYHKDLQKIAKEYGISEDPSTLKRGASFITPDGKFIHLPAGVEHPTAIEKATGERAEEDKASLGERVSSTVNKPADSRIRFLNDTGAVRTRMKRSRAGDEMHISVPAQGVTEEQIPAIRQAIAQAGRYGNLVMERADVTPATSKELTMEKSFPSPADTEEYLRQIKSMPTSDTASTKKTDLGTEAKNHFGEAQDIRDAGIILPDGSMIANRRDAHPQGMTGHWDTARLPGMEGSGEGEQAVSRFLSKTGGLRVRLSNRGGIGNNIDLQFDYEHPPTHAQLENLLPLLKEGNFVNVDAGHITDDPLIIEKRKREAQYGQAEQRNVTSVDDVERLVRDAQKDRTLKNPEPQKLSISEQPPDVAANKEVSKGAQAYNKAQGMKAINHEAEPLPPLAQRAEFADMYDAAKHEPNNPAVQRAYDAMKQETLQQFNHAKNDLGIKFEFTKEDPYKNASEMMRDVRDNKRLKVFKTDTETGTDITADHPMMEKVPGMDGITYNDLFRATHDIFGHVAGGHDFTEGGEFNAFRAHNQMYSPEAKPAVRTETLGQSNWVSNNKDIREGRSKQYERFADQKATILPEFGSRPWAEKASDLMKKQPAGGIDPHTGSTDSKGFGVEIYPEARDVLDHPPTKEDLENFYDKNREIFDKHPELRIGWDRQGGKTDIGGSIRNFVNSNKSFTDILDKTKAAGSTWSAGGCWILADAVQKEFGGKLFSVNDDGVTQHIVTKIGDKFFDADGEQTEKQLLQNLQDREGLKNPVLTPLDPKTVPSDIARPEKTDEIRKMLSPAWELNIGASGGTQADVRNVGKKLDQRAVWDSANKQEISSGGTGQRTNFENYPLEERLSELRGEPRSDIPGFQHVTPQIYENLEPDERNYLRDNKTLQNNVMQQYHKIQPSVNETTNAMQAGAAVGGWWKRYIDIFHNLADPKEIEQTANTIGPSHAEILKQWHAALSANKSVEDANNLAWHSYADWLDAGKPTDRKSIDAIIRKNGASSDPAKKGNAALSDTRGPRGKFIAPGLDTTKIFNLVNSPEMKGERPFHGDVFNDDTKKNPLMGKGEGYRKVPSMGATVAGKGNLNRLVIDTHIRDFYGQGNKGPAAQYIADSVHLRQAAKALGLKGGEGQEQLWGTVLGLKYLLKEGLTPEAAGGRLDADTINKIGKDYAEVIANDPEISGPGGLLDKLKQKYGIGRGSAGVSEAHSKASSASASESGPRGGEETVNRALLGKTAERIRGAISDTKIKKQAPEEDTSFNFGANADKGLPEPKISSPKKPISKTAHVRASDFINLLKGLKKPGKGLQ